MRLTTRLLVLTAGGALALLAAACSSSQQSADGAYADPTTRALSDPMNYSPNMDNPDISGGGVGDYHSQSMQKDVDHVLNP